MIEPSTDTVNDTVPQCGGTHTQESIDMGGQECQLGPWEQDGTAKHMTNEVHNSGNQDQTKKQESKTRSNHD